MFTIAVEIVNGYKVNLNTRQTFKRTSNKYPVNYTSENITFRLIDHKLSGVDIACIIQKKKKKEKINGITIYSVYVYIIK